MEKKGKIKIIVWVKPTDLDQFQKEWGYLFESSIYYAQNPGSFKYKGVPLYTTQISNFVQLQLNLKDYKFWLKQTKNN